jgi:hypothetical protein
MLRKKLGVWVRLGIVLTIIWLAGAAVAWPAYRINQFENALSEGLGNCLANRSGDGSPLYDPGPSPAECRDMFNPKYMDKGQMWLGDILFALGAGVAAWIAAIVCRIIARWVRSGREIVTK